MRHRPERNDPERRYRDYSNREYDDRFDTAPGYDRAPHRQADDEWYDHARRGFDPRDAEDRWDPYHQGYRNDRHQYHRDDWRDDEDWEYGPDPYMAPPDYSRRRKLHDEYREHDPRHRYRGGRHYDHAPAEPRSPALRNELREYPDGRYEDMERDWDRFLEWRERDDWRRRFRR